MNTIPDKAMREAARLYRDWNIKAKFCEPEVAVAKPADIRELNNMACWQAKGRWEGFWEALQALGLFFPNGYNINPHDTLRAWLISQGEMTGAQTLSGWAEVKNN